MSSLWDRVSFGAEGPAVGRSGVAVAEVVRRLRSGRDLGRADEVLGTGAGRYRRGPRGRGRWGTTTSPGPSLVQSPPADGRSSWPPFPSRPSPSAGLGGDRAARLALAAGLLQIHDFWERLPRRRAGRRRPGRAGDVRLLARDRPPSRARPRQRRLLVPPRRPSSPIRDPRGRRPHHPRGRPGWRSALLSRFAAGWNPTTLVELCTSSRPGSPQEAFARRLQRAEMLRLLEASAEAVGLG